MYRLMTLTCPNCANVFHVETLAADPPPAAYRCSCPRCFAFVPVPGGDAGEPQAGPTGWAVRATPHNPA